MAASFAAGPLAAAVLIFVPFIPAQEPRITGAVLCGFALGWVLLAVLSMRFTDQPQRWAIAPAVFMGIGGLLLLGFGGSVSDLLDWVWPPALLALVVWMFARARRQLHSRSGRLGSRKMWLRLRRHGVEVARCTVERLYRQQGWEGARYGKRVRTTIPDEAAARPVDLVEREFAPPAPNRLWVADFTYVPTWTGMVYVAFVVDAFARRVASRDEDDRAVGARCARARDLHPGP